MKSKEYYMNEALKEAKKAYKKLEIPVGAVIVKDGIIVARAHNLKEIKYANFDKIIECLKNNNRIALENNIENSLEQGILETNIDIKMLKMTLNSVISGKKFFMSGSGSTYYSFVTEFEKSQIETRLKTFVDNVKIIICNTIN